MISLCSSICFLKHIYVIFDKVSNFDKVSKINLCILLCAEIKTLKVKSTKTRFLNN